MIDGKSMLYALRENINESSTSTWMDDRTSYRYLWDAACAFVDRTKCMTAEQSITTVADQQGYTLNADFMRLYLKDSDNNFYVKYNNGTSNTFIRFKEYEEIIYEDQTTSISVPNGFSIIDDTTKDTRISATVTSVGATLSQGETTLTASAADFSDVAAGDMVHNISDSSDGVVLSKTSSTVLVTALFGGTDNDYSNNDVCIIQPQSRWKLHFDQPTSTASHTVTVYYVQRPAPVYSSYGIYRIPAEHLETLVEFAAYKYKMRDSETAFAAEFLNYWDSKVRNSQYAINQTLNRKRFDFLPYKRSRTHGRGR